MSEESSTAAGETPVEKSPPLAKVRRISNKPARKSAKPNAAKTPAESPVPEEEFDSAPPAGADALELQEESSQSEPKRKNRRRRGKGKSGNKDPGSSAESAPASEETIPLSEEKSAEGPEKPERPQGRQPQPQDQQARPPQKQRPRLDPEKVAKKAWKIYLAEVSEEGVALIGDNDARELSRRCFRLAEIFLEEQDRRQ